METMLVENSQNEKLTECTKVQNPRRMRFLIAHATESEKAHALLKRGKYTEGLWAKDGD